MQLPDDKDSVIARYKDGPFLLEHALADLKEEDMDRSPAKGGWTIRQIVHHIVDGDDLWKAGIKQVLGNDQTDFSLDWYHTLPQDTWAERWAYAQRPVEVSLALFKAIRDHVIQLLEHVPDAWKRAIKVRDKNNRIETVPVGFVIEMQANHVVHHLKQIEAILK